MSGNCTAERLADGAHFRIRRDAWFNDYPLETLSFWIDFYNRIRAQHPKSLHAYDETIAALEALADRIAREHAA